AAALTNAFSYARTVLGCERDETALSDVSSRHNRLKCWGKSIRVSNLVFMLAVSIDGLPTHGLAMTSSSPRGIGRSIGRTITSSQDVDCAKPFDEIQLCAWAMAIRIMPYRRAYPRECSLPTLGLRYPRGFGPRFEQVDPAT